MHHNARVSLDDCLDMKVERYLLRILVIIKIWTACREVECHQSRIDWSEIAARQALSPHAELLSKLMQQAARQSAAYPAVRSSLALLLTLATRNIIIVRGRKQDIISLSDSCQKQKPLKRLAPGTAGHSHWLRSLRLRTELHSGVAAAGPLKLSPGSTLSPRIGRWRCASCQSVSSAQPIPVIREVSHADRGLAVGAVKVGYRDLA